MTVKDETNISTILADIEPRELDEFLERLYAAAGVIRDDIVAKRKERERKELEKQADGQRRARKRSYEKHKERRRAESLARYHAKRAAEAA